MISMESCSLLDSEHKAIRRAVNVLRTMTEQVEHGLPTDRHDVNALLIFLHYFVTPVTRPSRPFDTTGS